MSFFSVCTPLQNESDAEIINIMKAENKQSENKTGYYSFPAAPDS